jgi:hypothetical protein
MKTNIMTMAVMRPPRLAGDRKPSSAKIMVMSVMPSSCTPVPTNEESSEALVGGLNTSPCTWGGGRGAGGGGRG